MSALPVTSEPVLTGPLLLVSPWAYDTSFKTNVVDGDIYGLWALARQLGIEATMVDGQHRKVPYPDLRALVDRLHPAAVVVHLWTADNYGEVLRRQCDDLRSLREATGVPVVAFGYLATTAAAEILEAGGADTVRIPHGYATAAEAVPRLGPLCAPASPVTRLLDAAAKQSASLDLLPPDAFAGFDPSTILAVRASRGCRARCSFCSYNADVGGGWFPRDIGEVAADISTLVEVAGVRRVALADADFGGSELECRRRSADLRAALEQRGLAGQVGMALATRPSTLSRAALGDLAAAGVDTILIGVETFDDESLRATFAKRHGRTSLTDLVGLCDAHGIAVVASYILWHPWQRLDCLRTELDDMLAIGRHRIPQFLARSVLRVQPGTPIEERLRREGLLTARPFHREFTFADPAVAAVFAELTGWYETNAAPGLRALPPEDPGAFETVARLKLDELDVLTELLSRASVAPHMSATAAARRGAQSQEDRR